MLWAFVGIASKYDDVHVKFLVQIKIITTIRHHWPLTGWQSSTWYEVRHDLYAFFVETVLGVT